MLKTFEHPLNPSLLSGSPPPPLTLLMEWTCRHIHCWNFPWPIIISSHGPFPLCASRPLLVSVQQRGKTNQTIHSFTVSHYPCVCQHMVLISSVCACLCVTACESCCFFSIHVPPQIQSSLCSVFLCRCDSSFLSRPLHRSNSVPVPTSLLSQV